MKTVSLNGAWKMRENEVGEWIPAVVPGSVFCDLLAAERLQDPYFRDNDIVAREFASKDYEYVRTFEVTSDLLGYEKVFLKCYGLDTLATVYVNGQKIAETDDMHRTYEFDVKSNLSEGENEIRVVFASALEYVREMNRKLPFEYNIGDTTFGFPHIRKAHNMFGWDSEPEIPDAGIWRDIELVGWSAVRLDTPYVRQVHTPGCAELIIEVPLERLCAGEVAVKALLTAPDGTVYEAAEKTEDAQALLSLKVENPALWWPNGYGEQPLYTLKVSLKKDGAELDFHEMRIGLRSMRVRREPDQWGESFEIEVNGVPIFAKGGDYIPLDKFLPRETEARLEKMFQDCVAVHHTCMRIWGGAIFPGDAFYDLADRYGIILWQDFLFACALYHYTPEFEANIIAETKDNIKRLRHHACLALWCGSNENEWLFDVWEHNKTMQKRRDYIRQYEVVLADVAEKYDPDRLYWPSSPSSDGFFHDPNSGEMGDIHCWDVWHNAIKPYTAYKEYPSRFTSEFGLQSFPTMKTIKEFTMPEDREVCSYIMDYHQRNGNGYGNAHIMYYVLQDLPYPHDFEKAVYASHVVQSECVRFGSEFWRRIRGRCMGALYWQVGDCWQAPTWASIDYAGRWKALHYRSRHFFAPVLLSIDEEGANLDLYTVSDRTEDLTCALRWSLKNAKSENIISGEQEIFVKKLSSACVLSLSKEDLLKGVNPREVYLEAELVADGVCLNRNWFLFVKPKHFLFADPDFRYEVREEETSFCIALQAQAYARYVYLDFDEFDCLFDDNYFDMSKGEKVIRIAKDTLSKAVSAEELTKSLRIMTVADLF